MEEVWKPCFGFEKYYEVSNLGKVKSTKKGNILVGAFDKRGYHHTLLSLSGKPKTLLTHRMVALSFIPNKESKPCVNHVDGNPRNNAVDNLEWVSYRENNLHSIKEGRRSYCGGEKNPNSKLKTSDVIKIRGSKLKGVFLAKKFNVDPGTISSIRNNKTWVVDNV